MKSFVFLCALSLALSGIVVTGCENGGTVLKVSESVREETVSTEVVTSSWSQNASASGVVVVVCVNEACEVYHEEEVYQVEGRL
ncbi:MAG: hypothetical protein N2205_01060 [Candidatus Caldatribacterium sp.]|uniref:hypothetical protein n=1 Tax=Candidatus Caldatribacterium sp. TaxID=2282143 RepID=UPI00299BC0EE|nr:hypothetical protein [Candidatus Caldatribacterium sp.]MCX7729792.1 hypothetical protein [Candidatus Caldatribacterium sp.]MDW8081558.1 hypothetical protein [Candidatus Calescibacterium sp.]